MISTIQANSTITVNKIPMKVKELNMTTGQIHLMDEKGRTWIKSASEFGDGYLDREITLGVNERDIGQDEDLTRRTLQRIYTKKELKAAKRRLGYVSCILDKCGKKIQSSVERVRRLKQYANSIEEKKAMSDRNTTRLYAMWNANDRRIDCLIPGYSNSGNRTERLNFEVKELISEMIQTEYLSDTRPTLQKIVNLINDRIDEEARFVDCGPVARSTVKRMVEAIPAYKRCIAREGYFEAQRRFPYGSAVVKPGYLNQEAELDHTPVDVEIRCPETGETIGRIWLTFVVGRKTGMIKGYYLTANSPCARSVVEAIKHASLPKDGLLEKYPELLGQEWPCWGLVSNLIVDNGPDLHSNMVLLALAGLGVAAQFNPKGNPRFKGKVERTLGVANEETTELMPGRTFANYIKKGDYKSGKNAILTMEEFEKILVIWIVKIFHNRKHRIRKTSPLQEWKKHEMELPALRLPPSVEDFDKLFWVKDSRKLGFKGIQANNRFYQSVELQAIAKETGHGIDIDFYIDESDISVIHVNVPGTNDFIDAFLEDSDYARLRLCRADHEEVIELALKRNSSGKAAAQLSEPMLLSAWNEIRRIRDEAIASKKASKRKAESKRRSKAKKHNANREQFLPEGNLTNLDDSTPLIPNTEEV
ncbi:MAG: hypothetical protein DRR42_21325 [Gammaproteobacteria bacterium]|nr:MAG: hypothetical protein DRR42_21325 [Gammaproteobacteria bacterium]